MQTIIKIGFILAGVYVLICILFYFLQSRFLFFPQRIPKDFKFQFKYPFEEVFLKVNKDQHDLEIHGLHFKSSQTKGVILYFHGNAGSLIGWGEIAEDFADLGYDVLIMDYRGYGKSDGKPGLPALYDDALLSYNYLLEQYKPEEIILLGRSLGTGISAQLASKVKAKMLILETPYYSLSEVAQHYFPILPVKLINRFPLNTYRYLQNINLPVFIIHGTKDQVVPYSSGEKLWLFLQQKNRQVEMITIPDGTHNDLAGFPHYWQEMQRILN